MTLLLLLLNLPVSWWRRLSIPTISIRQNISKHLYKLVITKGYGVRAKAIEGQKAFAPLLCFHVKVSQNTRDQIKSERQGG